ncbi:MAG: type VI secretion system tube protein Hcp [Anaerolineae bacterium]|nr:type VI secretion system tube protein Hcp [Anaerolineae bacterium]
MMPRTMITLHVTGNQQGRFKGDRGNEGEPVICSYYGYDLTVPYDPASGQAAGKRQHGPVVIRKKLNPTSPQLAKACIEQEVLKDVRVSFSNPMRDPNARTPGSTTALRFYSIKLTNARIVSIKHTMTLELEPEPIEEVAFSFEQIEYYSFTGGMGYSDPAKLPASTPASDPAPKPPGSSS